jgi:predicted aspartyl protease
MRGTFENDSIIIELEIFGVSEDLKTSIQGMVDTGFNGHMTIPFAQAFPLGLILKGEQEHTLADGQVVKSFVCLGTVTFAGKSVVVPIDIHPGGPVLIGMQLLKKLGQNLTINFQEETYEFSAVKSKKPSSKVKINL